MNRAELKAKAKEQIKGNIGTLFVMMLIVGLVGGLLNLIPGIGTIASLLLTPAFSISIVRAYLTLTKGGTIAIGDVFSGFDDFWNAFKVQFFMGLFTFLWALLFYIPGIVKGLSYSMAPYILAENKGKAALECINESKAMTNGHKMDLFVLGLSFIGWFLLGAITLGIAYIWIVPYMSATFANAYNSLKPVVAEEAVEVESVDAIPVEE